MSKSYNLYLRGYVGGADFDASYVSYILSKNANKSVEVLIDSLGGSLATALSVASAFADHGDVHAHFVGMNASAATIASLGAKRITMDANAMYLVHKCSMAFFQWASLNADQLEQQIAQMEQTRTDLEKMDANVASMYARKCKKTTAEMLALMKVGGWLTAQEALDWGFVDELTSAKEDAAPVLTDKVAASMASVGMPIPNVPIEQNSAWEKLCSAISSLLGTKTPSAKQSTQNTIEMKNLVLLASVLALDAITLQDGKCSLTEEQLSAIEARLKELTDAQTAAASAAEQHTATIAEKDAKIASLQALLEQKPAAAGSQVVDDGKSTTDDFIASVNAANELMAQLS